MARPGYRADIPAPLIDACYVSWVRYCSMMTNARQTTHPGIRRSMIHDARVYQDDHFDAVERAASARFPEMWHRTR